MAETVELAELPPRHADRRQTSTPPGSPSRAEPSSPHIQPSILTLDTPLPTRTNTSSTAALQKQHGGAGTDSGRNSPSHDIESAPQTPYENRSSFISALAPVDGGKDAWLFLLGATAIETLVWGIPFSVGILHQYWTAVLFEGQGGESTLTLAAALQTGLMYMSCGVFGPVFSAVPRWSKHIQAAGLVIAAASLVASAFVTKPWHLIVTIGIFYPFSTGKWPLVSGIWVWVLIPSACYVPCCLLMFEWFSARRGLASGIMYAGTGAGGTIFPFVMTGLLNRFGYKTAMICMGIGFVIVGALSLWPIKRRIPLPMPRKNQQLPVDAPRPPRRQIDWGFVKKRTMAAGVLTIMLTSCGNFIPSVWLPSFVEDLSLSFSGVGLISLMNAASVPGNTLLGYLSDRYPLHHVITLSCLSSSLACLFLWGFGTSSGPLIAFVLVFGCLGLSLAGLWSKMISIICGDDPTALSLVFSAFCFVRGVGNITSGPIADALLKMDVMRGAAGAYGMNNYGVLLIYTGLTIFSGCISGLPFKERKSH